MIDETRKRGISPEFEAQLTEGILLPLLQRVRRDDTLSLEVRNGYVDIYYRGGRLLGLHEQGRGAASFRTEFDKAYLTEVPDCPLLPPVQEPLRTIKETAHAVVWVDALATYKQAMDIRFSKHTKIEREYQQAVVRDNNRHSSGDKSDYCVVDIEYAQSPSAFPDQTADYRFDMVGFRWPVSGGTRASKLVTPVIMEMKAGDGVLASHLDSKTGKKLPGLVKHIEDIERFLAPADGEAVSGRYELLCDEMKEVYALKQRLELNSIPKRMRRHATVEIDTTRPPEVLFVIANHQPTSSILKRELQALPQRTRADYYVASVTYAGYALFADNLKTIEQVIEECSA
jgi:hypothetical protein